MSILRYRVTPEAPFATPLRSDTLHGQLLCAARELDGEGAVGELIQAFEAGEAPFVTGSAFPEGMLPMPVLPGIPREAFADMAASRRDLGGNLVDALAAYKRFRKVRFLPWDLFRERGGKVSMRGIFHAWLDAPQRFEAKACEAAVESHNAIDRRLTTVRKTGGLFFSEVHFHEPGTVLDLLVRTTDAGRFERYLEHVAATGFGADASTGRGHFSIERDESFDGSPFDAQGSHHMTLSVASAMDLSGFRGHYATFTKYGKIWSGFGEHNPFKKPFLAFAEGSVFSSIPAGGFVLRHIHADPKVVQVTWPLTLPLTLEAGP